MKWRPNFSAHVLIVWWVTLMPRAASISSTMRRLSGKRWYSYCMRDDLSGKTTAVVERITGNLRHDP